MKPTNPQAFAPVLAWLDAGAPHGEAKFDMFETLGTLEDTGWNHIREVAILNGPVVALKELQTCGVVCCIAGALVLFSPDNERALDSIRKSSTVLPNAEELAGMSGADALELFTPCESVDDWHSITPAWAAATIRHYIETGEVDWKVCKPGQS
jgi:hypothetical protein